MSSPSDTFECQWRPSRRLLAFYLIAQLCAISSSLVLGAPVALKLALILACLAHAGWAIPRKLLLSHPTTVLKIRYRGAGWSLWSPRFGWRPADVEADSLALPMAIVLRYRHEGQWWARSLCIPADSLDRDTHRRLRVRLKFARGRRGVPALAQA